jgi:hypothetical protein
MRSLPRINHAPSSAGMSVAWNIPATRSGGFQVSRLTQSATGLPCSDHACSCVSAWMPRNRAQGLPQTAAQSSR